MFTYTAIGYPSCRFVVSLPLSLILSVEFDRTYLNLRKIAVTRSAREDGTWRCVVLCDLPATNTLYVVMVDLTDKDQYSASVNIQTMPSSDRRVCEDRARSMVRSWNRHSSPQQATYVKTSVFSIVYVSVRWKQERLVLTIEHLGSVMPCVPASILCTQRLFDIWQLAMYLVFFAPISKVVGGASKLWFAFTLSCLMHSPSFHPLKCWFSKYVREF